LTNGFAGTERKPEGSGRILMEYTAREGKNE
jgi:hypothetical protein